MCEPKPNLHAITDPQSFGKAEEAATKHYSASCHPTTGSSPICLWMLRGAQRRLWPACCICTCTWTQTPLSRSTLWTSVLLLTQSKDTWDARRYDLTSPFPSDPCHADGQTGWMLQAVRVGTATSPPLTSPHRSTARLCVEPSPVHTLQQWLH